MAMVVVDVSSLKTGGLTAQVRWLGLRVDGRLPSELSKLGLLRPPDFFNRLTVRKKTG